MAREAFNRRWAENVETQDSDTVFKYPGDLRVGTGWEGGQDKDAPPAGQENWWHNRVDSGLQDIERHGVMTWHEEAVYGLGAPTYLSGNYYESLYDDNVGNNPASTTGFWRYTGSSFFSGHEPGDCKIVWHNNIPSDGWLKCNGAVLLRASYPRLFAAIGTSHNIGGETVLQFRLPDARGEFLRGFDDGRGVDPNRVFGSSQSHAFASHTHSLTPFRPINAAPVTPVVAGAEISTVGIGNSPATASAGGTETRPRNKTVNYWIKY